MVAAAPTFAMFAVAESTPAPGLGPIVTTMMETSCTTSWSNPWSLIACVLLARDHCAFRLFNPSHSRSHVSPQSAETGGLCGPGRWPALRMVSNRASIFNCSFCRYTSIFLRFAFASKSGFNRILRARSMDVRSSVTGYVLSKISTTLPKRRLSKLARIVDSPLARFGQQ